ncbi:MAG: DUF4160 domain-containing protein [Planctomycetota bacterium]
MPTLSQFHGVHVRMRWNDHAPPHFHAVYGECELLVRIAPAIIQEGNAPARVRSMVLEWTALHQRELMDAWERCRVGQQPVPIEPLE